MYSVHFIASIIYYFVPNVSSNKLQNIILIYCCDSVIDGQWVVTIADCVFPRILIKSLSYFWLRPIIIVITA